MNSKIRWCYAASGGPRSETTDRVIDGAWWGGGSEVSGETKLCGAKVIAKATRTFGLWVQKKQKLSPSVMCDIAPFRL